MSNDAAYVSLFRAYCRVLADLTVLRCGIRDHEGYARHVSITMQGELNGLATRAGPGALGLTPSETGNLFARLGAEWAERERAASSAEEVR